MTACANSSVYCMFFCGDDIFGRCSIMPISTKNGIRKDFQTLDFSGYKISPNVFSLQDTLNFFGLQSHGVLLVCARGDERKHLSLVEEDAHAGAAMELQAYGCPLASVSSPKIPGAGAD